ncbi:hypothetical protein VPG91_03060 [Nitrospirillum amazonense]|uniref:hypothetical protein n=1 Tax=Nitrospirillum amazonense TaxID=28077 RepID=UPI002DD42F81|nr:hypothetical protein [Nitrospirillum amazonense]MEC4589955.1 hypothetical protein [Nitrospirillum amazonense]
MAKQAVTRGQGTKKTQQAFLLGASALAIGVGLAAPKSAWASACGSFSTNSTIGSAAHCTSFIWTGTLGTVINNGTLVANNTGSSSNYAGFSIQGGKTLTAFFNNNLIGGTGTTGGIAAIVLTGTPTYTTTSGTISYGISAYTTIGTFVNNAAGLIQSDGGYGAIRMMNGVKVGGFTNDGTILANGNSALNLTGVSIGTLTNSGYIYSSVGGAIDIDVITTISTVGTIINSGMLRGNSGGTGAVNVFGVVGSVNNTGTILNDSGPGVEVRNYGGFGPTAIYHSHVGQDGTLSTLTNSGLISGTAGVSIGAGGSIVNLTNTSIGTIQGGIVIAKTSGNASVTHNGYLGTLANNGVIIGSIATGGLIGTLINTGTISATGNAISIGTSGTIAGLNNSGVISGNIVNNSANTFSITGGTGTVLGTFTGASGKGSIINTLSNIVITGGNLFLNDNINVGSGTLISQGTNLTIAAGSTITGNYYNTLSTNTLTTSGLTVTGRVTLITGTIVPSFSSAGNYIVGTAASLIYSPTGISNLGSAFAAVQAPTGAHFSNIGASGTTLIYYNPLMDYVGGAVASVSVGSTVLNGVSTIYPTALYIASTGTLGTLTNTGTIRGDIVNLSANDLSIRGGTLTTIGTLTGYNNSIGTINNTNSNVVLVSGNLRINDVINVGSNTLVNNGANVTFGTLGTISLTGNFAQTSTLGTLSLGTNLLSISGAASIAGTVLSNFTTTVNHTLGEAITLISAGGGLTLSYGTLTGVVSSSGTGINVTGTTVGNNLLAMVQNYYIAGTYGTITNTGTLTAASAVYVASTGTLGAVSNTGVIQGSIVNNSVRDLTLLGGSAGTFGTFTGLTGTTAGSITNTASNVTLSGNVLLNDAINATGHTVVANGASIYLTSGINITGNYSQTGGTLAERSAVSGGELIVSGAAVVSGVNYTVVGATGAYHYLQGPAGATPIIAGGVGSSYTSITYDSGITGLTLGGYTQGTSLWGTVLNDYVGDSLASISIGSGTLLATPAGVATLIYIAGSGVLGTLSNSGTIQGNIANNGSADLNLRGGSATWGTFAGAGGTLGTITSTGGNVVVSGGQVYLADQVNVGSGLLYNTGGTLGVAPGVTVTGNYLQNSATGTLVLGPNAPLVVTGSAIISDGYIKVGSFDSLTNHVAGETTTLVQSGASSTYTLVSSQSVPVVQSNVGGLGVIGTQVGNNLQAVVENDYFGTSTAAFTQSGTIVLGTNSQASAALYVAGTATIGSLTNTGVLNGEANFGNGIFMGSSGTLGASIGTLVNTGTIAGRVGVANYNGVIGTIDNSGQILDSLPNSGIYNGNTITLVNNQAAGTIAGAYGIANSNLLGTLLNAGLVAGSVTSGSTTAVGVASYGTLNTLTNSGRILATAARIADGVLNYGTLGTLTNATGGTIGASGSIVSGTGNIIAGVANGGTIGTLSNSGLVTVTGRNTVTGFNVVAGIANLSGGTINVLSNASTITAAGSITDVTLSRLAGLFNAGVIGTLSNTVGGVINGLDNYPGGGITQLTNAGLITSAFRSALFNEGTIGTLTNSGTIQGPTALRLGSSGTIGTVTNSGTIAGSILNGASTALTIGGGAGTVVGVLTGVSGSVGGADKGRITSTGADLVFGTGNLLLNDDITATGRTVVNSGASLRLSNTVIVTGAYTQGATGTLVLGSGALLSVTGAATVTAGTVTSSGFNATGNYLAGGSNVTLVQGGAGSSYNTTVVAGGGITGLGLTGSVSGNNLLAVVGNDYVGASLGSIVNSGSLSYSGASTGAVYVAGTGSLGTLVNSGTIAGSIAVEVASGGTLGQVVNTGTVSGNLVNLSTNGLVLSGGTVAGTYTGGTITSTLANVTLASGAMVLGDAVNVGAGTLVNGGASVSLNTIVSVTGNYGQTGGTLNVGANALVVSGAAVITGGTVVSGATFSSAANYLAGSNASTLIQGGAGSSYSGYSVSAGSLTGLAFGGTTSGTNLVLAVNNDYVGTLLPTLNNTGSIGGMLYAAYVTNTGAVGTLNNSGTLAGVGASTTAAGVRNAGSIGTLSNSGVIGVGGAHFSDAVFNTGTIGTLLNASGTIAATVSGAGVENIGLIGSLGNSGTIIGASYGLENVGTIGTLNNSGLLSGNTAISNAGTLGVLINSGSIGGNLGLYQHGAVIATLVNSGILGRNGGIFASSSIDTLINSGTLLGTLNSTGALMLAGTATIGTLVNSGIINGNITNNGGGGLTIGGGIAGTVGTLTGGTISSTQHNVVFSGGALALSDAIDVGANTVANSGAALTLGSAVSITGNYSQSSGTLVINPGVSQLVVSGLASITGGKVSASLSSTGNYLAGGNYTLVQGGAGSNYTGATLTVTGGALGLSTGTSIATIGGNIDLLLAVNNDYVGGTLATLTNTGTISANTGIHITNGGSVGVVTNSGLLNGRYAFVNQGSVGTLVNTGVIAAGSTGVQGQGNYGTVVNSGTISGVSVAVAFGGSVGTLVNSGLINGSQALYIGSILGTLVNTGTIAGTINNAGGGPLTIIGGTGGTIGTLTGQSGAVGALASNANVVLASGSLLLNDQVVLGGNTLSNMGASVRLGTLISVTGQYSQTAGTLDVGAGRLVVSGAASITGGTVVATLSGTANYLAGQVSSTTLVTGGVGSNYTGANVAAGGVTGLAVTGTTSGTNLVVAGLNDYVGTVLGSLNNTGTISASNAVYVAATGTLGSLTNTGTLLGANAALNNLGSIGTITIGTLTGTGTTTSYGTVGLLQGAVGITNAGSIGTLVSYATIIGTSGAAVDNQGSMYSLGNAGTITGVTAGINNAGSIGGLVNANQVTGSIGINNTGTIAFIQNFVFATDSLTTFIGSISGSATGLSNAGVVGTLVNAGAITGSIGLNNSGTVLGLANALFPTGSLTAVVGSIAGSATGVRNTGVIGTLLNQGLISGGNYALYNGAGATLGTIANAGTISGNIVNLSATDLVIAGGGGTLTGGSISNTASNLVFAGGTQVVNDALNVGSHTVVNSGASLALGGDLSITGNYSQATGTLGLSTNHLFVSGVANVSGGVITASVSSIGNYVVGSPTGAILVQGGAGSSYTGVSLTSDVTGLTIAAGVDTIGSNVDLVVAAANDYIGGTLGSLGNSGTITGVVTAAYIATLGSLGTLANSGLLDGARYGIRNRGTIGLVDNSGTATGLVGLWNQGVIGTVVNTGLLKDAPSAQAAGLNNAGSIGVLTNMGSISSVAYGLYNSGSIGGIDNSGVISATDTITGRALRNAIGATITAIGNSGTIAGATALYNQGSVGTIANSGVIAGNVVNASANALVFTGGTGATIGTLTGATGVGTISSTLANVVLAGGNLALNDQVDLGGTNTLVNGGASLRLSTLIAVTGTYSQSAGTLQVAYGSGQLAVSAAAVLTGGTIAATGVPGTINMLAGVGDTVALVAGGVGSSYTGLSYTSDVTGMEVTGSVGGNSLYLAGINDYVGGTLGTLSNSGTINANNAVYVAATGTLGSLTNSGTLAGANAAINNLGSINSILNGTLGTVGSSLGVMVGAVGVANAGSIGTLTSYGTILGTTGAAVDNQGMVFGLGNAGTITGVTAGVNNAGTLSIFQNAGLVTGSIGINNTGTIALLGNIGFGTLIGSISGSATGLRNTGVMGTLLNQGLISGGAYALYNGASATLGTVLNAGTISGNIANLSATDLVIAGGGGTLTGGSITNTASNVVFAGGAQVLGDSIVNVGSHTVVNSGASLALASTVTITGNYSQATGTLALGSNHLEVSGVAAISGGTITADISSITNYIVGSSTGVILVQGGAGSSYTGVGIYSGISGLTIGTGVTTIGSDVDLVLAAVNDYIGGTLASLNNTGTISGVVTAAYIAGTGSLGTLSNSGLLEGELYGIHNQGTIGLVDNSGTASGVVGLFNQGTIGTVLNTGLLKDRQEVNAAGLNNTIGASIGAVINQGTISSVPYGLYNSGTIASIANSGVISATDTVSGQGLHNSIAGVIGTITNSGTIAGVVALYNEGSIGTIANSGTIAGSIVNTSANALVFTGGSGSTLGTLTGTNGIGTITSTLANVELASGNLVLNDQVNVGAGTLVNSGANVLLTNAISVTGNYAQSAGTLAMGIGSGTAGELLVSGNAAFTGGTVAVTALSGSNLIAGQSYTIAEVGGTLTTSGLSAAATGFSATLGTGANGAATDLLLTLLSDYVSGTLGTLTNTGTINAATAVLITSAGSLGTLANSGAIIGNVVNASANDLVIVGGSGGTVGSFNGGTIRNSLSNLTFASGAVSLADAIDVTGHTVSNSGASLTLAGDVAVTGNYSQTAGTLAVAGHSLSVSGAAQVTGGVVDAGMTGTANYLVGDSVTLIRGGNGSTYTGATVVSGLTGLDALGATSGSNLLAVAGNDYIGASLATLSVTGTLVNTAGGATALYIASTGTLGSLANSGTISGNVTNVSARDLTIIGATGGGSNGTVGSFTGGTIRNTGANVIFASGAVSLGDAIDVGGTHTVSNIGAAIGLASDVAVTGTYAQSAGSLNVAGHVLTVSGPALVSGGTVSAGISGVGNYFVGDSVTMIQGGAGSSYTGAVVTSGLTGLDAKGSVSGGNLLAVAGNDYIGASLATLNVTGTLVNTAGGATALYIASTGTLGSLANSGAIVGNVVNQSARDLTINGGGNGAVGRFSGGTIANTGANVVFASGAVSLGDAITVATHTVSNAGASIALASDVAVTGNFAQSSGTLTTGGHVLTVSGAATVAGGVVNAGVSAVGNYIAGDRVTLIQGGTGSNYAGATVTSGITGLSATAVTSGSNLLAAAGNDYIGASLDTLNNTGTVASPTALYIAATGTLGTLANSGALAGNITNLSTGDLIINGGSLATPGTLTGFNGAIGTISNTGSNVRFTGGVQLLNDHITVGSHTVFNSGATLLVNSAINITGAYSQSAGTLAIGVTSQTSYGNLAVSGAAAFTGGSVLLQGVGSGAGALQAGTYTIASGNGLSLSGVDFTATGYTVTSDLVTVGNTTQLVVKVAGKATNYTAVGNAQGGAAVGTGSALDQIAALAGNSITTNPQVAAFTQQVLAPLATLTPAAKQVAVAQLSPSQLTPQLTATSVTPTTTAISQHQETVASLMDGSEKGMAAGSNGREGVIWGEIVGAGVLRGTTTEAAGYRASSSGLVLGADWFASDEVMAGLAFSWINSASVGQGVMAGSLTRVGSYQLTAYSVWRPDFADQKLSVEGQVGWGYNHFDQRRDIAFLGARANANYGGEQYLGKVTVGYDLPQQGAFTFTPQYSLRFVRLVNHAYQEHDAGPADLKVDVLGTNAVTQELGLKVDTQWNTGVGLLSPDLRVAWVHDFKDGPIPTTGVLAGVAFASTTGRVNTDGLAVNLGATLQQSEAFSLRLEYNGEYRHDYQSHGGVLRASWSF